MNSKDAAFLVLFVAVVHKNFFESIDPNKKALIIDKSQLLEEYDFIIIGAGSAGATLANRLSENENWKILLLEAGGTENAISEAPRLAPFLQNSPMDWNYTTVEQKKTCRRTNGICPYPRGKVLGGTSTINLMMFVRGNRDDFDEWARMGNPDWSYDNVLPYFIKLENVSAIGELKNSPYHGVDGPIHIQYANDPTSVGLDYIKAGAELNLPIVDYNGESQVGIGHLQLTIDGPSRDSTSKAYLDPIRNRENLHISAFSHVTKISIDEQSMTATGVEFIREGTKFSISASKEVILSAGAINSPQLLMLSGIGPKDHLESLGINVILDLPVGENLVDHLSTRLAYTFSSNYSTSITNQSIYDYSIYRKGILTGTGQEVVAFLSVASDNETLPDIEWVFGPDANQVDVEENGSYVTVPLIFLIKPYSRGSVRLNTSSPFDDPLIDTNYLDDPRDHDTLKKGLAKFIEFANTSVMRKYGLQLSPEAQSLCFEKISDTSSFLDCMIEQYGGTLYHPIGTVKMGPDGDPTACVNQALQLHGIHKLRVIDASIMPTIPRANTNAAAIMIGEKGADIIKNNYRS